MHQVFRCNDGRTTADRAGACQSGLCGNARPPRAFIATLKRNHRPIAPSTRERGMTISLNAQVIKLL
ncbi:hypothetical protein ABTH93_20800, partial [Acinetobacter baumannii]